LRGDASGSDFSKAEFFEVALARSRLLKDMLLAIAQLYGDRIESLSDFITAI
jgi:hypothetical protein